MRIVGFFSLGEIDIGKDGEGERFDGNCKENDHPTTLIY